MSGPATNVPISVDEYVLMDDPDELDQLVRGRVVREPMPGEWHGLTQARIARILGNYIEDNALPLLCGTHFGLRMPTVPESVMGPDVAVIPKTGEVDEYGFARGVPALAVEIVSPGSRAARVLEKVHDYLDCGAQLVWVVYPKPRTIVAHRNTREATFLSRTDRVQGDPILPGFSISVDDLLGTQPR